MPRDSDHFAEVDNIRKQHPNCIDIDDIAEYSTHIHDRIDNRLIDDEDHLDEVYNRPGSHTSILYLALDLSTADSRHPHQRTTLVYY